MQTFSTRYEKFLNGYEFYPNSISFRILSSKALEKWKNVQSFQLNQLVNGKFYFPSDRREILLLKYDMWSRWLYEIENLCIQIAEVEKTNSTTKTQINYFLALCDKTEDVYKDIMLNKHAERFDTLYTRIWLEVHENTFKYIKKKIMRLSGLSLEIVFGRIVDILCEAMQYTLIEIYELDNFYCKQQIKCLESTSFLSRKEEILEDYKTNDAPFIIITEMINKAINEEIDIIANHLTVYKKYFNFDTVYLKNYTDEPISESVIEKLKKHNIIVDFMKSLMN